MEIFVSKNLFQGVQLDVAHVKRHYNYMTIIRLILFLELLTSHKDKMTVTIWQMLQKATKLLTDFVITHRMN